MIIRTAGSALAAFLSLAVSAQAADLFRPAQPPLATMDNWSGVYIGLNAGHAWGDLSTAVPGVVSLSGDYDGWLAGAQIGANFQRDQLVFGVEADIQASDLDHSESALGFTAENQLSWFSTLRGRAGFDMNGIMPYLTGGLAFGRNNFRLATAEGAISESKTHVGWTVGGGVEAALSETWSVKAEYLYVDLGSETYLSQLDGGFDADADFHALRVGVNWRFAPF